MTCPKNDIIYHDVSVIPLDEPGIEIYFAEDTPAATAFKWHTVFT